LHPHHFLGFTLTGNISAGSIITLLTAIVGFCTVAIGQNKLKSRADDLHETVSSIDKAVNGKSEDEQTLRENVQDLHNRSSNARTRGTDG
jgi:hypothetical protein